MVEDHRKGSAGSCEYLCACQATSEAVGSAVVAVAAEAAAAVAVAALGAVVAVVDFAN